MNIFAGTLAGSLLALTIGVSAAQAGILASGEYRSSILATFAEQPLILTGSGAKTVTFSTNTNNKFVTVTYHAQCSTYGEPGDYLSVRIAVDGVSAHPRAGADFALCSAVNAAHEASAGVSRQALVLVPRAGRHRVQVFGSVVAVSGASKLQLQHTSIIVQD